MVEFGRNASKVFKWLIYRLGGEETVDSKMDFGLFPLQGWEEERPPGLDLPKHMAHALQGRYS